MIELSDDFRDILVDLHDAGARRRQRTAQRREWRDSPQASGESRPLSNPNQDPYFDSIYAEELGPPMPTLQKMFPFVLTQVIMRPPGSFHCVPRSNTTDAFEIYFQAVKLPPGDNLNRVHVWLVAPQEGLAPGWMLAQ